MKQPEEEDERLQATALQNMKSILQAQQRAEADLVDAKDALEARALELVRTVATLRATLESTTDGILVTDAAGAFVDCNAKLVQAFGLSPEGLADLDGPALAELLARQARDRQAFLARLAEIGRSAAESFDQLPLADGRTLQRFSTAQVVDGRILGRVWCFRDISDQLRAQYALRDSERKARAIFEQAGVGMLTTDLAGRFLEVNPRLCQILGYSSEELRALHLLDVAHPAESARTREHLAQLVTGQVDDRALELRCVTKQGGTLWGLATIGLLRSESGEPERLIGVIEDISERKGAEARERESAQRLEFALSAGQLGDWSWDAGSDVVTLGPRAATIFGLAGERPITRAELRQLVHPEDRDTARAAVEEALAARKHFDIEYRLNQPAGDQVWIAAQGRGLYTAEGGIVGTIGVVQDVTERKRFQLVRERLALVVESSEDAIVSKDLAGIVQTWNKGAERIFGYTAAEMVGQSITRLIPPDLLDEERSILQRQRQGERIEHYETLRLTKDGRLINVSLTVSPIRDAAGKVVGAAKIARDISEQKLAEAALRRSEEELRALADSIPQLAWTAQADGYITWFNRGWHDYTGTTFEEVEGWGWQSVHDEKVLPRVLSHWHESLRTGTPFEMEFPLRGADGKFRWFLTRVRPIRDETGRVVRWFGTNTDVDEVKRAREALWDESRLLNLLNETGKSIASDLDLPTMVQTVTDATTQLSGAEFGAFFYNTTDEAGESFLLFALSGARREDFEQFGQPRATPLFGPTFNGQGPIRCDDVTLDPRYGKWGGMPAGHLPVRSYLAVPVISRNGEVFGGLFFGHSQPGMFSERSERLVSGLSAYAALAIDNARLYERAQRAAEERQQFLNAERGAREEAERASYMKDEFLATLSHELRTPLNAIVGWAQVLRMRGHSDAEVLEGLAVIDRNAKVQAQLIEDLLDMSRIISGKVRLDVQRVDIQDVVQAALASVQHSANSKDIRLQVVLDPRAGIVLGDPSRLQQCFWNLLSNAIKFTPKGGKIQVSLARINSHLEFTVVDNGQGISAEFLPLVFERFRQADASTTRQHGGLGLGLSIVKNLVELHGGAVSAESAGLGLGATFRIELPMMVVGQTGIDSRRAPAARASLDHPSLEGIRVLAVDDEPDSLGLVKRVLEACGAQVFVAESAAEGLEVLRREKPDLLISDIGMPGEDGYEFIRRVRDLLPEHGGRIPAAALSALARPEDRTRALRAGYQTHLAKPVEPTELTAVVASLALRK